MDKSGTANMDDLINNEVDFNADQKPKFRASLSMSSIKIIPQDDIARVKDKLNEELEFALEEAIKAHKNI